MISQFRLSGWLTLSRITPRCYILPALQILGNEFFAECLPNDLNMFFEFRLIRLNDQRESLDLAVEVFLVFFQNDSATFWHDMGQRFFYFGPLP